MLKKETRENEAPDNAADFPLYLYHHGKNDRIYELFGAHKEVREGQDISSASGRRMRAAFPSSEISMNGIPKAMS